VISLDADDDVRTDLAIAYHDGTIRFLKNYGGRESLTDMWSLLVISDGVREIYPGDVDGDGDDDILVVTNSDKLRAYTQEDGVWDVDGWPICLSIPWWEYGSISSVTQLFVNDINADWNVDIVTNSSDWEVELFYWWWNNYISLDQHSCDDEALTRNEINLLKTFKLTAGIAFSDQSLVHWDWLDISDEEPELAWYDSIWFGWGDMPAFELPNKKTEIDALVTAKKADAIAQTESLDIDGLIQDGVESALDYLIAAPETLRSTREKDNENYAFMRGQDSLESKKALVKVSKTLTDNNWGTIEKWDLLTLTVSLDWSWPIDYVEKLDMPVLIFRNENGVIHWFDRGTLPDSAILDRNVWQWYEFHITDIPGSVVFSYQVQYDWNWYANVSVEPDLDAPYEKWSSHTASLFSTPVHAQSGPLTVRIQLWDWCYKQLREYTPGEIVRDFSDYYKEERDKLIDFYNDQRTDVNQDISEVDPHILKDVMGIDEVDLGYENMENIELKINNAINQVIDSDGGQFLLAEEYTLGTEYLETFSDTLMEWMDTMCKWMKFWETSCGWLPVPFNMAFLSPGTFNIFGCELAKDKWLPLVFFPATIQTPVWPVPSVWPIGQKWPTDGFYRVGGWVYDSLFRMYVSPTLTWWLWLATCFGPYKAGMNIKSPVGDIAGNCVVLWWLIWPSCTDDSQVYDDDDGQRNTSTLTPEMMNLWELNTCDPFAQQRSNHWETEINFCS